MFENTDIKTTCIEYTNIPVLLPNIEFFIKKIENNQPFHFIRLNHGIWDLIYFAYENNLEKFKIDFIDKKFKQIAEVVTLHHINNEFYKHQHGEGIKYWHNNLEKFSIFFEKFLHFLNDYGKTEKFQLGLSTGVGMHTQFGVWDFNNPIQKGRTDIVDFLINKINNNQKIFYSGITKHYVIMDEIKFLIDKLNLNNFTIVFLGDSNYSKFNEWYNINNFEFIEIPHRGAMDSFDDYIEILKKIQNENNTFLFYSCGHILSVYLAKSFEKENLFAMDVGKSFEIHIPHIYTHDWAGSNLDAIDRYKNYIKTIRNG